MGELPKTVINILTLQKEILHLGITFSQLTDVFCLPQTTVRLPLQIIPMPLISHYIVSLLQNTASEIPVSICHSACPSNDSVSAISILPIIN
jgi:hypothetical protein